MPRQHIYGPDDERIGWNPDDPGTVEAARARWEHLEAQGYEFYAEDATLLDAFDAALGVAIASPTMPPPEVAEMWATGPRPPV